RRGSRNGPKVEGYGGLLRCANNALMDWIMSPSSGQAIIWRWLNQQSGSGLLRGGCQRVVQHVSTQEP
ncbi:hypothetical protein, partial [Klebsiella quasipneumoniae]|uniref:hypothetical protein n=1 Tax=Klebsiella quasipneumoniae TaxID=1463165 RepID=UPI001B35353C